MASKAGKKGFQSTAAPPMGRGQRQPAPIKRADAASEDELDNLLAESGSSSSSPDGTRARPAAQQSSAPQDDEYSSADDDSEENTSEDGIVRRKKGKGTLQNKKHAPADGGKQPWGERGKAKEAERQQRRADKAARKELKRQQKEDEKIAKKSKKKWSPRIHEGVLASCHRALRLRERSRATSAPLVAELVKAYDAERPMGGPTQPAWERMAKRLTGVAQEEGSTHEFDATEVYQQILKISKKTEPTGTGTEAAEVAQMQAVQRIRQEIEAEMGMLDGAKGSAAKSSKYSSTVPPDLMSKAEAARGPPHVRKGAAAGRGSLPAQKASLATQILAALSPPGSASAAGSGDALGTVVKTAEEKATAAKKAVAMWGGDPFERLSAVEIACELPPDYIKLLPKALRDAVQEKMTEKVPATRKRAAVTQDPDEEEGSEGDAGSGDDDGDEEDEY